MSDLFVDMQQRRTAAALETANQRKNRQYNGNNNSQGNASYGRNNEYTRTPDTAYSSQHSTTTTNATSNDVYADADVDEEIANVLSLKLRKPKHWRWELSTSRSCSNIALPRILLYDHKGQLLVDVDSQEEQCYSQPQTTTSPKPVKGGNKAQPVRKRVSKAASTNLAQSIKQALERQFSGLQIQEATPSPVPSNKNSLETTPSTEHASTLSSTIDYFTNELPDYKIQRRANSLKGVRFKVNEISDANSDINGNVKSAQNSFNLADLPTPPSTTTTTTTPSNSSSSGPREKRRYRRSHSSGRSPATSESILERFSLNKGRFSSPEYAEEHEVYHAPRYFLRTSKAGTLVVQEESFSRCRRRRKLRNSSTENIRSGQGSGSKSSLKMSDSGAHEQLSVSAAARTCGSLLNVTELGPQVARRKVFPVRRYRSDGNVLLQKQPISSDEHEERERAQAQAQAKDSVIARQQQRKYRADRRPSRKELIIIDPENVVQPGAATTDSR